MSGSTPAIPTRSIHLRIYAAAALAALLIVAAGVVGLRPYLAADRSPASGSVGASRFDPTLLVFIEGGSGTTVAAIDAPSGRTVGSISLGFSTMALFRQSAGEILVSDLLVNPDDPARASSRLLVMDRSLGLKRTIQLEDRIQPTLYAPAMLLSPDERTLYYVSHVECGIACDDYRLNSVLVDEGHAARSVALPRNCGFPQLSTVQTEVVILCPQIHSIWRVGAGDTASQVASMPALGGGRPITGSVLADGKAYIITQQGRLLVVDGSRVVRDETLVAAPERFSGLQHWRADGRIILAIKEGADMLMTGVLVLEPGSWHGRRLNLPDGSTFAAYMGGDRIAVVHVGGLTIMDLAGSTIATHPQLPSLMSSTDPWVVGAGD